MPTEHSWWSPSGAPRAIRCPASVKAAAELPLAEDTNSEHADEGIQCHDAMHYAVVMDDPEWGDDLTTLQKDLCDIAWTALNDLIEAHQPDSIKTESRVNLGGVGHEDVFGTADLIMYNSEEKLLIIADYKFGYNEVDPSSEQLLTYAVGAMEEYPDTDTIITAVIQPKLYKEPQTHTMGRQALHDWCVGVLVPAIEAAKSDDPPFEAGPTQCKFCPVAKHGCKFQTQQYLTAIEEFQPQAAYELDDKKLAELVSMVPAMQDAIKAVETAAVQRLKQGSEVMGERFKLVRRQTKRTWEDKLKTADWLRDKRFKIGDIYDQKLKSPAQIEKLVKGKKYSAETLQEFTSMISKPEGQLTYAPITDKRKAVELNERAAIDEAHLDDLF